MSGQKFSSMVNYILFSLTIRYIGLYAKSKVKFFFCFRLSLAELLDEVENNDGPLDIFVEPPDDGAITECDSDASDEECEGNLNHLGSKLLRANCEFKVPKRLPEGNQSKSFLPNKTKTIGYYDFDSSDEEPLCKYSKTSKKTKSVQKPINIKWKIKSPEFDINTKCEEQPVSFEAQHIETPLEFFKLFWSEELLTKILAETNLYSLQKNINLNITMDELYVFLGGLLLSGYAKYPNKRMYWSGETDVPTILQNSIRLNRYEQILRNIHLNDNNNIYPEDRLYKLRPLITELNKNFRYHGGLEENLSIDESMIPYYGRHYAKQYIKGKPIRFGFKNWALCTSNGYMIAFDIYTGKSDKERTFGIGGDTVLSLIRAAEIPPKQGFKFYFDNYFSSVRLFHFLSEEGFAATGTIQDGRTGQCFLNKKNRIGKAKTRSI